MQRNFSVFGKGTGEFLSPQFDAAATLPKMPLQKGSKW
jgi:hypothetical protein